MKLSRPTTLFFSTMPLMSFCVLSLGGGASLGSPKPSRAAASEIASMRTAAERATCKDFGCAATGRRSPNAAAMTLESSTTRIICENSSSESKVLHAREKQEALARARAVGHRDRHEIGIEMSFGVLCFWCKEC